MNNPPAFPMIRDMRHNADWDHEAGMSLRDYFAAKALQSYLLITTQQHPSEGGGTAIFGRSFEAIAQRVYQIADAMLKAREST